MFQFTGKEGVLFVLFHVRAHVCDCYCWERVSVQIEASTEPHPQNKTKSLSEHFACISKTDFLPCWFMWELAMNMSLSLSGLKQDWGTFGLEFSIGAWTWGLLSRHVNICLPECFFPRNPICSVRTNLCSLLVSLCHGVLINTSWFLRGWGINGKMGTFTLYLYLLKVLFSGKWIQYMLFPRARGSQSRRNVIFQSMQK